MASTQVALERELADRQAAHERALALVQDTHEHKLAEVQDAHQNELAQVHGVHDSRLAEVQTAHEQTLVEAQAAHKRDLEELEAAAKREVAAVSTELETLRTSLAQSATPPAEGGEAPAGSSGDEDQWQPVRLDTRYLFPEDMRIQINADRVTLCDLSTSGCQIISPATLRPGQVVKVLLPLDEGDIACSGTVVWARVESGAGGQPPSCRAGLRFAKADTTAIEAFVIRYALST